MLKKRYIVAAAGATGAGGRGRRVFFRGIRVNPGNVVAIAGRAVPASGLCVLGLDA
jgi:hypothetical protein